MQTGVQLNWSTASEVNTKDFVVEYSNNTQHWTPLGTVQASNNSTTVQNYSYYHANPLKNNTYNYYRILQRDIDGKFSYSQIVLLKGSKLNGVSVSAVYPNPAKDKVSIVFNAELATKVNIAIVDVAGKIVQQKQATLNNGQTSYISDISTLRAGNYIIKVTDISGAIINIQKLNKQ